MLSRRGKAGKGKHVDAEYCSLEEKNPHAQSEKGNQTIRIEQPVAAAKSNTYDKREKFHGTARLANTASTSKNQLLFYVSSVFNKVFLTF